MSQDYCQVCSLSELVEGQGRAFEVAGQVLVAFLQEGQVYVYINSCPHLGIPLEWQENEFMDADGMLIQCSTHGALFLVESGECVSGPCQGEHLSSVEVKQEKGYVWAKI